MRKNDVTPKNSQPINSINQESLIINVIILNINITSIELK
jgi:hypothetical protein